MARLMTTGAGGMLGQAVAVAAAAAGDELIETDRAALDITDSAACERVIADVKPDALINCAAWTDVDGAEASEAAAFAVNEVGARNLAEACAAHGVRMIQPSTDYVFDGSETGPYVESSPVNPQSAYGRSKLAGELAVAAAGGDHAIVRTSWLFGPGGRNFVDTMLALASERPTIDVVRDQIGSPTWAGHLAPALVALSKSNSEGVFHAAGGGSCSWWDLATAAFEATASPCEARPVTSDAFPRAAQRPANSSLASERGDDAIVLPDWREGLAGHLEAVGAIDAAAGAAGGAQ